MPPPVQYSAVTKVITHPGYKPLSVEVPRYAKAQLKANNINGGSVPLGTIEPPGWLSGSCPSHHNRGHLIGNALGGSGGEPKNLVTLVGGTNHPIMFDFEDLVKAYVVANRDDTFKYVVWCRYSGYTQPPPQFPIPGATGNPFCIFPAPARLFVQLRDARDRTIAIRDLLEAAGASIEREKVERIRVHEMENNYLIIPNGVYKATHGGAHVSDDCWQVNPATDAVVEAAQSYANGLGYQRA